MKIKGTGYIRMLSVVALVALTVSAGCQGFQVSNEGTTATQEDNIVLQEAGPHEGRWEDANLIVNYTFDNQSDGFEFSGTVELAPRLDKTFRTVSNFSVRTNFLDEDRIILKSVPIIIAGNQAIRLWRFSHYLDMPSNVESFNFSYSGRAAEGGTLGRGVDGADTFFWRVP